MNRRYLAIIKINNLKDTTANVTDSDKYSMAGFSRGGEEFSSGITTANA